MSNETITDLRQHLFAALRGVTDKAEPMDIDRARAVAEIGKVIIDSAKVEVDFLRITGSKGSGFIPDADPALPSGTKVIAQGQGVTVRRHTLRG